MFTIVEKILPIILLCSVGFMGRRKEWFDWRLMTGVKRIVINFALPAVLFRTFLNMDFQKEYFLLSIAMVVLLLLLFGAGKIINLSEKLFNNLNPYLTTGFAFGLLGIPLFSIVFGEENLGALSIMGFGHEMFVWFIYYTLLRIEFRDEGFSKDLLKGFMKSPLVISVLLGFIFNVLGFTGLFGSNVILKGIDATLAYMGSMATPLILITIGYGMKLDGSYFRQSIGFVLMRFTVVFTVGYSFKFLVIDRILAPTAMFNYAFLTFLLLPPLFSMPIFVGEAGRKKKRRLPTT